MEAEFTQIGGVRYGESFWYAANFTWPFARLSVARQAITLSVSMMGFAKRTFTFPRVAIRQLRWKRGIFSRGLLIEHTIGDCPPFVLFWVSNRKELAGHLRESGYEIELV